MIIKLLVPIGEVPDNATVTKKSSLTEYTATRRIRFFNEDGLAKTIEADKDTTFIIGETENVTALSDNNEVVWYASRDEALYHLQSL